MKYLHGCFRGDVLSHLNGSVWSIYLYLEGCNGKSYDCSSASEDDCPSASEVTLNDIGKMCWYLTTIKQRNGWIVNIKHGMYYITDCLLSPLKVSNVWITHLMYYILDYPDSKVHGSNVGPIWGRQDPGGPHDGPMNFAIRVFTVSTADFKCSVKRLSFSLTLHVKIEK